MNMHTLPRQRQRKALQCVRRMLLAMLAASALGCATHERAEPSTAHFHTTLERLAAKHHVCAVAIAIIKQRRLDAVDVASGCEPAWKPDANSVFQAASLSKPVFAYAVLKLVEQGKFDLDAPVMQYLPHGYRHPFQPLAAEPADAVTDPRIDAITVRMLLNHSAGLPNWASGPLRFGSSPGEKWAYSGEGFQLLQRAAETLLGQPLDHFMQTQVFQTLAMDHSDFVWRERIAPQLLPGTKANGTARATPALTTPIAAFSLYTSAADYGKFLVTLLNDAALLKQITSAPVAVDARLGLSWGLGWGIEHGQDDDYLWQWGSNTGYRAFVMASVKTGDGVVMLTNSENGLKLAEPITQRLLPGEHKVFQSPIMDGGVIEFLCASWHLCF
jgi:CubicO group peptidase (beta-lactamase class C family)